MTLNVGTGPCSDQAPAGKHKFVTLDGMRGIAAICVLLYHCTNRTTHAAGVAYAAVDIFFTLSGFVIAYSYNQKLPGMGFAAFLRARLIRLYPLYFVGLLLGIVAAVSTHAPWIENGHLGMAVALGLCFLPDLSVGALFPLNNPAWSLFFELTVNAVYAVFRPVLGWMAVLVAVAGLVYAAMTVRAGHALGAEPATFWGGFPRVIFSFYCGVAIHALWRRNLLPKIRMHPAILCILLFLLLFLSVPGWHGPQYFLIVFLLSPLLIVLGCQNESAGFMAPFCRWLGMISYALYTLHDPLRQIVEHLAGRQSVVSMAITLLMSVAVAHLVTVWVDRPARQILSGRRVASPMPQATGS